MSPAGRGLTRGRTVILMCGSESNSTTVNEAYGPSGFMLGEEQSNSTTLSPGSYFLDSPGWRYVHHC